MPEEENEITGMDMFYFLAAQSVILFPVSHTKRSTQNPDLEQWWQMPVICPVLPVC